jgi:tripartite-type tricarboxylate transporter receptor subunit TctC
MLITTLNAESSQPISYGSLKTDLLGGRVQLMFESLPSSIEYIRTGKLRALAVTTAMRSAALPDIPTVAELVPGYEASQWYGLGAPKNTPAEIVEKLNREINAALTDPKMKARVADLGGTPLPGSSAAKKKARLSGGPSLLMKAPERIKGPSAG